MKFLFLIIVFVAAVYISYSMTKKRRSTASGPYRVTKNTLMGELLDHDREVADVLVEMGMHCVGCPSHSHESLEQAAAVHNIDTDELVNKINDFLSKKG